MKLYEAMRRRLKVLVDEAEKMEVRLMVDAEQTYFQPAIDNFVLELQRKYNTEFPTVFNTYQCYLTDSRSRVETDIGRSEQEGWCFGAKLVRGAYMFSERERAKDMGYPSPIHSTIQDTHDNYNQVGLRSKTVLFIF